MHRSSSLIAEPARMPEHSELRDVASEQERDGPVDDDSELSREEGELVEVVRPGDEPAGEAAQWQAEHEGDAFVSPQRRDLAEGPVSVRLGATGQGLHEATSLA